MGKILLILTVLTTTLTRGQVNLDKFDEIVLVDYQNWSYKKFYGRTYSIKPNERPVELYDLKLLTGMELLERLKPQDYKRWEKINSIIKNRNEDSILDSVQRYSDEIQKLKNEYRPIPEKVKSVDMALIESLKIEILKTVNRGQILEELGLTKDSIEKSLNHQLVKYLDEWKIKYKPEKLKFCIDKLKDIDKFNKVAMSMTHSPATGDYSTVSIEFRNQTDTLKLYTKGQFGFMLPWTDQRGQEYSYNPNLSKAIGLLLPDYEHSNRDKLLGQRSMYGDYVTDLYYHTFEEYCITKKNKLMTK
jgi:D-ribose pyranose/furanose isomerase RbsD